MRKKIRYLFIALVGLHTLLWVVMELLRPATGGVDQSPAYLFVLALYVLDTPARWLLPGANEPADFGLFFLAGSLQWAVIAGALAGILGFLRHDRSGPSRPEN